MDVDDNLFTYKLVLLGETAVGKSSLVLRFVKDEFNTLQESTIGAAFFTSQLQLGDDTIKFEIWDTAGQERYQSLAPMYYRNAKAAIVVYDITDMASFDRAKKWVDELMSSASLKVVIALCGNKADLESDRKVPTETAKAYAASQSLLFFETSAKTRQNVKEVFESIAKNLDRKPSNNNGSNVSFPDESSSGGCAC